MGEKLTLEIDLDTGEVVRGLDTIERKTDQTAQKVGTSWTKAGKVAGGALLALGVASAKAASDFETKFAKVRTLLDGMPENEVARLRKGILGLGGELGEVGKIADATYQAISAGVEPAKAVGFITTAAKAAKGGFTDVETAVDGATTVLNSYGDKAGSAERVFDLFLATQNRGKTTLGEVAGSIGNVAKTAADAGIPLEDLAGMVAAITKRGVETNTAMTSLRNILGTLEEPSQKAAEALKEAGVSLDAFKAGDLVGQLSQIAQHEGLVAKVFGVESRNAAKILGGDVAQIREDIEAVAGGVGSVDAAFKVMNETSGSQFQALWGDTKRLLIDIGGEFMPGINSALKVTRDIMQTIRPEVQAVAGFFGDIANAVLSIPETMQGISKVAGGVITSEAQIKGDGVGASLQRGALSVMRGGDILADTAAGTLSTIGGGLSAGFGAARSVLGFAKGGIVPGSGNTDSVPALLTPGEMVIPKHAVQKFAEGGMVGSALPGSAGYAGGGGAEDLAARVRSFWKGATGEGVLDGIQAGAKKGVGTGKGAKGSLFDAVFHSSLKSATAGTIDAFESGDVKGGIDFFADSLKSVVMDQLKSALVGALGKKIFGGIFGGGGGFFADGGRPPVGEVSVVGERGPELFVPDQPGTVVPNHQAFQAGPRLSISIGEVTFSGDAGSADPMQQAWLLAERLADLIERREGPGQRLAAVTGAPA